MKLKDILKHTPAYQYVRLEERLKIVAIGYPESKDIKQHEAKKVGLISVQSGVLHITVY